MTALPQPRGHFLASSTGRRLGPAAQLRRTAPHRQPHAATMVARWNFHREELYGGVKCTNEGLLQTRPQHPEHTPGQAQEPGLRLRHVAPAGAVRCPSVRQPTLDWGGVGGWVVGVVVGGGGVVRGR